MNNDTMKFFDLSSYMLFEDTGDSETIDDDDHHALNNNLKQVIKNSITKDEDHDDDAMSCSSVLSEDCLVIIHNRKRKESPVHQSPSNNHRYRYLGRASEDDEEGIVNQALKKTKHDEHQESRDNNCGDNPSIMNLICQREQDKLFWEACLGS
ncbi:hypothetical protein LIER_06010 [Lithospermum erythrorhizon]|uniref:Uncharacterized protein n=1 Tax=Lithospermum erythrorhizon TaxID=34254 RepID=A0AAV3P5B0_LITER